MAGEYVSIGGLIVPSYTTNSSDDNIIYKYNFQPNNGGKWQLLVIDIHFSKK